MNQSIFREYDIRGVADRDMPNEFAEQLGLGLGTLYLRRGAKRIGLGADCRLSSPRLHGALRAGLQQTGIDIVELGVVPTPLMYFSVFHQDLDGGIQITGSHNPPQDNGFKLMLGKGTLFGKDIQVLREMIEQQDFIQGKQEESTISEYAPIPAYAGFIKGNLELGKRAVRFAADAGNGTAGPAFSAARDALGLEGTVLYSEMDGTFPNHHPDPSEPENLKDLENLVLREQLDVGFAFDGDSDRIGLIDDKGQVIWGDRLMILLSREILKLHPGAAILGEVKCSQVLYDDIEKHGGRPILWKTGHSLIKQKMKEEKALLAGEMSGHIFFADRFFGFDDAIYTAFRVIELLSHTDKSLSELLSDVPETFSTPEIRVPCSDEKKFDVVDRVRNHFAQSHNVIDIDGARVLFDQGWGLVRASNTQPVLVMRFEAESEDGLKRIRDQVERVVSAEMA